MTQWSRGKTWVLRRRPNGSKLISCIDPRKGKALEHKELRRQSKWWGWKQRITWQYVSTPLDTPPTDMFSHRCARSPTVRRSLVLPPLLFFGEAQWHQKKRFIKYWNLNVTLIKNPNNQMKSYAHVQRASGWLSNIHRQQPQICGENLQNQSGSLENQT